MTMKSLGPGARKIYYHRLGPYALLFSKLKTILHTDFSLGILYLQGLDRTKITLKLMYYWLRVSQQKQPITSKDSQMQTLVHFTFKDFSNLNPQRGLLNIDHIHNFDKAEITPITTKRWPKLCWNLPAKPSSRLCRPEMQSLQSKQGTDINLT